MTKRTRRNFALFRLGDYLDQPDGEQCFLTFLSGTSKSIILSCLRYAEFVSTRWYVDEEGELELSLDDRFTIEQREQVSGVISAAVSEVVMSCASEDFFDDVSRIAVAVEALASCCASQGGSSTQDMDSEPHNGVITVGGPSDQFETGAEYLSAKCSAANSVFDTIRDYTAQVGEDVDNIKLGLGMTSGLLAIAAIAGPASWAIVGVSAALMSIAFHVLTYQINYSDMEDGLDDVHSDLVCALYGASDSDTAKATFLDVLSTSDPALSVAETALVGLMLTGKLTNQLFAPRSDVAVYTSPDPVDCAGCTGVCDFEYIMDDSDPALPNGSGSLANTDAQRTLTGENTFISGSGWFYRLHIELNCSVNNRLVQFVSTTGATWGTCRAECYNGSGRQDVFNDVVGGPTLLEDFGIIKAVLTSSTPFTVELIIYDELTGEC